MREIQMVVLTTMMTARLAGAAHAVVPNCCLDLMGAVTVMNPANGAMRALGVGPLSATGFGNSSEIAITKDGRSAVVVSDYQPAGQVPNLAISLVNLSTGNRTGPLVTPGGAGGPTSGLAVNPQSGAIYVEYGDALAVGHLLEIDPATLTVRRDMQDGDLLAMTVSPDGKTIYGAASNGIVVLRASDLAIIGTVSLPSLPLLVVSPDGSTVYATYFASPYVTSTIDFVDAATLKITQSIPLNAQVSSLAVAPDGSEIYFSTPTVLLVLNTRTLIQSSEPVVPGLRIAISASGDLYWVSGQNLVVFDPITQAVKASSPAPEGGFVFVVNPVGGSLCFLISISSEISAAGKAPSQKIMRVAPTGYTPYYGAYDSQHKLVLLPDMAGNVDVLDGSTLEPKGYMGLLGGIATWVVAGGGAGYAILGTQQAPLTEVLQFDPVSFTVTGIAAIPFPLGDNSASYAQPALSGSYLYVPYNFSYNRPSGISGPSHPPPTAGIAVIDTQTMKLANTLTFPGVTMVSGFAVAPGGKGYLNAATQLLEIDLSTGAVLRSVPEVGGYLAASPDGATLYMLAGGTVVAINTQTLSITGSSTGLGLFSFSVTPDGQYIYGSSYAGISIIAASTLRVVDTIVASTYLAPSTAIFVD